jgi:hypothetical protein
MSNDAKPNPDSTTVEQLKASPPVVGINRPLQIPWKFAHASRKNHLEEGDQK